MRAVVAEEEEISPEAPPIVDVEPEKPVVPHEVEMAPSQDGLNLQEAIDRIPAALRKEMEDQLRAEFREVRRWKPGHP